MTIVNKHNFIEHNQHEHTHDKTFDIRIDFYSTIKRKTKTRTPQQLCLSSSECVSPSQRLYVWNLAWESFSPKAEGLFCVHVMWTFYFWIRMVCMYVIIFKTEQEIIKYKYEIIFGRSVNDTKTFIIKWIFRN